MDPRKQLNLSILAMLLAMLLFMALCALDGCGLFAKSQSAGNDLTEQTSLLAVEADAMEPSVSAVSRRAEPTATATQSATAGGTNTAITTSVALTGTSAASVAAVAFLLWRSWRLRRMLTAVVVGVERFSPARSSPIKEDFIGPAAERLGVRTALKRMVHRITPS